MCAAKTQTTQDQATNEVMATLTPEQQQAAQEAIASMQTAAEAAIFMQDHPYIVRAISAAVGTAGVVVVSATVAQAVGTAIISLGGGAAIAAVGFYGIIAAAIALLMGQRELLDSLSAMMVSYLKKGYEYIKDLASQLWGWIKRTCSAFWDWLCSLFGGEPGQTAAPTAA